MAWPLLLALAVLASLHYTGLLRLSAPVLSWIAAGSLLFAAARLAAGGKLLPALLLGGIAALMLWQGRKGHLRMKSAAPAPDAVPEPRQIVEARAILGVGPDADAAAVRAAYRQMIERVHPDKGGSAELTRQVNAARDLLLRHLGDRPH